MACYLDYVTSYTCTPSARVCVRVTASICCVPADADLCVLIITKSQDIHTPEVCAHTETEAVICDKMSSKNKREQVSV